MHKHVDLLVKHFGSQAKAAKALGVSQPLVSYWLSGAQRVSADKAILAESLTSGAVRARDLCHLIAEAEDRRKMSESSPLCPSTASGPDGSVCVSSPQELHA
jgi:DNA-binding transcriptional regulator YdaS (Cro superfamily)